MFQFIDNLNQLPSFQALNNVEAELEALKTPSKFDVNDPDQLAQQAERVKARAGLDQAAAVAAFRLEVATSTDSLLTLGERLAVVAAFDPVVRKRHKDNDRRVRSSLSLEHKNGVSRQRAIERRRTVALLGAEGLGIPAPLNNAEKLAIKIDKARSFAQLYAGEEVAVKLSDLSVITGRMPAEETSFALSEPLVSSDGIDYDIPTAFQGISHLTLVTHDEPYDPLERIRMGTRDVKRYPNLFEVVDGGVVANPQLSQLRQQLGFVGVNIYRDFHRSDFDKSIVPRSEGWSSVLPTVVEPRHVSRSRRDTLLK